MRRSAFSVEEILGEIAEATHIPAPAFLDLNEEGYRVVRRPRTPEQRARAAAAFARRYSWYASSAPTQTSPPCAPPTLTITSASAALNE